MNRETSSNRFLVSVLLSALIIMVSCGRTADIEEIKALERKFYSEQESARKSEYANLLHRRYSIYHLTYENDTTFLLGWARMAKLGQEYEQARKVYSKYLELNQSNPGIFVARADLNALLGYLRPAGMDYLAASYLTTDQKLASYYSGKSKIFFQSDSIISYLENNDHLSDQPFITRLKRAEQYIKCEYFKGAKSDIDLVLNDNAGDLFALYLQGWLAIEIRDFDLAEVSVQKFIDNASLSDSLYPKVNQLNAEIRQRKSLDLLEKQLGTDPRNYQLHKTAGALRFQLKDYALAKRHFSEMINIHPDSVSGYLYRGQSNIQMALLDQALDDLKRALIIEPLNMSAHNLKAYVHLLAKDSLSLKKEIEYIQNEGGTLLEILKPFS